MQFHAIIQLNGKTATGICVPSEVVAALGPSKRPPVRVTINGYTYHSTVASLGGEFMLGVSAEVRQNAGVAASDAVEVDIERDTEPRTITMPPDLADALDHNPDARRFFDGLSYSKQQRIVFAIVGAKTAETRQRRIANAISMLREGRP
jgi:hypothetical protein